MTLKNLAKTIQTVRIEDHPWRTVFHRLYDGGFDDNDEVLKIQLDRRLLVKHDLMHWDFVQTVPCCELDPGMNFLYVPQHTDLLTVLKGDAAVLDVQKIGDEVHVETSHASIYCKNLLQKHLVFTKRI